MHIVATDVTQTRYRDVNTHRGPYGKRTRSSRVSRQYLLVRRFGYTCRVASRPFPPCTPTDCTCSAKIVFEILEFTLYSRARVCVFPVLFTLYLGVFVCPVRRSLQTRQQDLSRVLSGRRSVAIPLSTTDRRTTLPC